MAIQSFHNKPQDTARKNGPDIARTTNSRKAVGPAPLHPNMRDRVTTSLGAPPTGAPPDASSPTPVDHEKQHGSKTFPKPAIHSSMVKTPHTDSGDGVLSEAVPSGSTKLPATVKED